MQSFARAYDPKFSDKEAEAEEEEEDDDEADTSNASGSATAGGSARKRIVGAIRGGMQKGVAELQPVVTSPRRSPSPSPFPLSSSLSSSPPPAPPPPSQVRALGPARPSETRSSRLHFAKQLLREAEAAAEAASLTAEERAACSRQAQAEAYPEAWP